MHARDFVERRTKNSVASLTPGTSITSLWLLRSRPDQIHED